MDNRSCLNAEESVEVASIYRAWQTARDNGMYVHADTLRTELLVYGVDLERATYHPVFESPAHRQMRLNKRKERENA